MNRTAAVPGDTAGLAPIVAIATAPGRGAVGIVRASGLGVGVLIDAVCGRPLKPRWAHYGPFRGADGAAIDHGLALHFPAPHSYTGEDVLELQAHGGPVVLQLLLARCLEAGAGIGLRLAQPGEFTQRAWLNGKLDLAQAEAVGDLIDASTEAAARAASRSLAGDFSARIDALRGELTALRTLVEATLDFPEEEIDFLERSDARGRLDRVAAQLRRVLDASRQGALLRDGITVVIAGQPNVGKSSLLNALAGAELAIVTAQPGTTRDKVAQTIQIDGVPVHVVDTAGIRGLGSNGDDDVIDVVERIGIARSWDALQGADAVLLLHDLTHWSPADSADPAGAASALAHREADAAIEARLPAGVAAAGRLLHVFNKRDAIDAAALHAVMSTWPRDALAVSALTGDGLPSLRQRLLKLAGWQAHAEGVFSARARQVDTLRRAGDHLDRAIDHANHGDALLDLLAEELRLAHRTLGEVTGEFTSDQLLGEIFGRFCIGK